MGDGEKFPEAAVMPTGKGEQVALYLFIVDGQRCLFDDLGPSRTWCPWCGISDNPVMRSVIFVLLGYFLHFKDTCGLSFV